jgi:hypothetical protein
MPPRKKGVTMKKTAKTEKYSEFEIELARRILCSTLSLQMGISYQRCWKIYVEPHIQDKEVGLLYLECARLVVKGIQQTQEAMFSGSIT